MLQQNSFSSRFIYVFTIFSMVMIILLSEPANAATDTKTAQKIENVFGDMLKEQQNQMGISGIKLGLDGKLTVVPHEYYYSVTLPSMVLTNNDGSYFNIGIISMNVMPGNREDQWKTTLALPSPITLHKADGTLDVKIDIIRQNFSGIWSETANGFISINSLYEGTEIYLPEDNVVIAIPSMSLELGLKDNGNSMWSGPTRFVANDIAIGSAGTKIVSIGKLSTTMELIDYNIEEVIAFNDKIAALTESYNSGDTPSASGEHLIGMYNLISRSLGKIWDGFKMDFTVEDIQTVIVSSETTKTTQFRLSSAGFGLGLTGFRNDDVSLNITSHYNDMSMKPMPPDFNEATPTDMNINISINKLPFKELLALGSEAVKAISATPEMAAMASIGVVMKAPQILTKSGTNLAIKNTYFSNDVYNVLMEGILTANLNAVMGAQGNVHIEIFGLNKLLGILDMHANNSQNNAVISEKLKKLQTTITMLQLAGQKSQNTKGQPIHTYDIELTKEGKTLLNDTDIKALMGNNKEVAE